MPPGEHDVQVVLFRLQQIFDVFWSSIQMWNSQQFEYAIKYFNLTQRLATI